MASLKDKVVVLTGASRGIGAAAARMLAEDGPTLVLCARTAEANVETKAAVEAIGASTESHGFDVSDAAAAKAFVDDVVSRHGRIDVLVNNAAIDLIRRLDATSLEEWNNIIAINQTGTFLGMKTAATAMISGGYPGSIVNISSVAGLQGVYGHGAYVGTKFAVRGLTKTAAKEWGRHGIRVNSVHPGLIETPMTENIKAFTDPEIRQKAERNIPLGRVGQSADIASMVLYLASDESSYCTGQEFVVDGGVQP